MALLKTCCCWCNVRSGSISCGVYTLILSVINGGLTAYNLFSQQSGINALRTLDSSNTVEPSIGTLEAAENWFLVILALCVALFIASIILVIGVIRGLLTFNIVQIIIWLTATMLNVYCLVCVVSQYQELKAGRGTRDYFSAHRGTVHYRPGIQQVHITQGPIYMPYPGQVMTSTNITSNENGFPPSVTAATTLIMAPPDYQTAMGNPPQYEAAVGSEPSGMEPLVTDKNTRRKDDPSPPPYSP
ncbi:hypothetical protein CAPTEDRAFT_201079 [Capitella teleta]|uniref:Uncharacterized protein n=1 Tax=Capitella teleta TaxID=283909 RepID=R7UE94_CAPTE|nr:hypothetical protein CAPTEDRAFT_201079 [Capitella teleta]|eukprot:ELU04299.1 hypothetical protein CAPTEDRAFT_201079 [Capitella teleta]